MKQTIDRVFKHLIYMAPPPPKKKKKKKKENEYISLTRSESSWKIEIVQKRKWITFILCTKYKEDDYTHKIRQHIC